MSLGHKLKEFVGAHGIDKTKRFLRESLRNGKINPDQISIRNLAEGIMGYNWYPALNAWRDRAMRRVLMGGSLRESADVATPAQFSEITGQLMVDEVWKGYNDPQFIGDQLCRTIPCGPNLGEHIVPGLTNVLNDPGVVAPGESFPYTKFGARHKTLARPQKYGQIAGLTFEAIHSDLTGQIRDSCKSVGWRVRYWKEEQILSVVMGLTNNYKEAVGGATSASSKNTYQTSDWNNVESGQTLTNLRPIQTLRLKMRRIEDPDTGKRIQFPDGQPILVMPGRELDAQRILTATQIRMGDITSGTGEQVLSDNPFKNKYPVISSSIAEALLVDSGVSQSNADDYFWHGQFNEAFYWRQVHDTQVNEAPPMNPLEFNNDIVLAVRAKIFGVAGVWEPRIVGKSYNS